MQCLESSAVSSIVGSRPSLCSNCRETLRTRDIVSTMCDRDADRSALVGDGSSDRLTNPPSGIGAELEAAAVFELIDRTHQTGVPLLDQVEEA